MSGVDKNKLDELFRKGLGSPDREPGFAEDDWNDLEAMLDGGKKRRGGFITPLWPYLSGVAALLLLALGWWFFSIGKPAANNSDLAGVKHSVTKQGNTVNQQQSVDSADQAPQTNNGTAQQQTIASQQQAPVLASTNAVKSDGGKVGNGVKPVNGLQSGYHPAKNKPSNTITSNAGDDLMAGNKPPVANDNTAAQGAQKNQQVVGNNNPVANPAAVNTNPAQTNVLAGNTTKTDNNQVGNANQTWQTDLPVKNDQQPAQQVKPKVKKTSADPFFARPQFAISVMASPDVNGVNTLSGGKLGTNFGMLFSANFGKLSISTGAAYAKKPYATDPADYHTNYKFKVDPTEIYADCRVLDIPLNIDYRLYRKNRNSFSVGTGLSSYIMLSERYDYDYSTPGAGPAEFFIKNRNQHILGVLNLNTTYQRQVNSKLSVGVQPYLKIPLTDIGSGQVRLRSAGVAVGFSWNISPSRTP